MKKQINRMTIAVALISTSAIGLSSTSVAQTIIMDQIGPDDGSGIGTNIFGCQDFEAMYDIYDLATLDNFTSAGVENIGAVEMCLNGWNGFVDPSSVSGYTANLHSSPSVAAINLVGDIGSSYALAADCTQSATWTGAGFVISMPTSMFTAVGDNWISMTPSNDFAIGGQTGVADALVGDGVMCWNANPGGGFGMPGNMQELSDEAAYRIFSGCEPGFDCNKNGIDDCDDIWDGTSEDCNFNGIPDECDISTGVSQDEDFDGIPDECQDCNGNGIVDSIDISNGTSTDCNENGLPDECEDDCNNNGIADECDIAEGTSQDIDENGIPDECQDCNNNGIADHLDIQDGTSFDCDQNGVPDECQPDCDGDGWIDPCDNDGDLDGDGIPDNCEEDCNGNTLPDHWEIEMGWVEDCNDNLIPDECDLADGTAEDCNNNLIPDECDIANGTSQDADDNGIPDECELPQTWTVDDDGKADFDNIQDAVDASSDGDEIIVMPGTYTGTGEEVVNMLGKAVWLHSSDGQEVTIINGQDQRRGILCDSGETSDTVIEGLTISNGYSANYGGGMYNFYTSPTLTDCTFTGNTAISGGGGMYNYVTNIHKLNPTLTDCTFVGNIAEYAAGMGNDFSSPTLIRCTFTGNSAAVTNGGGGMYNFDNSNPTLISCTFTGNTANIGAGLINLHSNPTLTNCTFTENNDASYGGGMYNSWSDPTLTHCTFTENNTTFLGGGMYSYGSNPTLTNCTFAYNTASGGGGMYNDGDGSNGSPTLADCTFECNVPTHIEGHWIDDGNNLFLLGCCEGDINGDWYVNINDLLSIFGYWGSSIPAGDLNSDGIVNVLDLLIVVSNWGPCE